MQSLKSLLLVFLSFLVAAQAGNSPHHASDLYDLDGVEKDPFASLSDPFVVFFFIRADCPISNRYAPEIQRLQSQYMPRHVAFRLVYCDPDETPAQIHQHIAEYRYHCPAFRDPTRRFAAHSHVTVTPEAAIYRKDGTLLYHGRIDDRVVDFGQSRPAPTRHDLALALDAAIAGLPIPAAGGHAVGCFIEPAQ
jgi:hypothetical protein